MSVNKSSDPTWNHFKNLDPKDKNSTECKFCGKTTKCGIYQAKQHVTDGFKNTTVCPCCSEPIRQEIIEFIQKKKNDKDEQNMELEDFEIEFGEEYGDDEPISRKRVHSHTTSTSGSNSVGPLDVCFTPDPEVSARKKVGKQMKLNKMDIVAKKELRSRAYRSIARWMYDAGISFNAVSYDSFQVMVNAVGQYGPGLRAPTPYEVEVPLLKQEVEATRKVMKDHEEAWTECGCSILSESWKDKRERTLINFLVNCPKGSMFLESVDASAYVQTGEKMFELLSKYVEKVGVGNVVQVVTDSAANNILAGKYLEAKYPTLFWTPCAAHCVKLILEDIFKLPNMKKTFDRVVMVNSYIYNRSGLLNMMKRFTNKKKLFKPTKIRIATAFIILNRMHSLKSNLKKMFTSDEWVTSKWAEEARAKKVVEVILMPSFWINVLYALKVSGPLVRVLRLVNDERKLVMGYIYEVMNRAKEAIAKSFDGVEKKYEAIFRIIDNRWEIQLHRPLHAAGWYLNPEFFYSATRIDPKIKLGLFECIERIVPDFKIQDKIDNELSMYVKAEGLFGNKIAIRKRAKKAPVDWWTAYGDSAPTLQKFAIKILNLTCSSSSGERDLSVFENLHSKRRNRLAQSRLNDLVFVKYNRALRRRYQIRDTIDPITLTDIDDSNKWLNVRLDEEEDDKDDDTVFPSDDGLTWSNNVAIAVGVGELSYQFRDDDHEEEEEEGDGFGEEEEDEEEIEEGEDEDDDFDDDFDDA